MRESTGVTRVFTFVVRFWREWSSEGMRWRGRVQHVESGNAASFLELSRLVQFLRSSGVLEDEGSRPDEEE